MVRPSWDDYFIDMAKSVAGRSTCPRLSVGAVVVKNKKIISTGYNGAPSGLPHCTDVGCMLIKRRTADEEEKDHCVRIVHAEQNAILHAAQNPVGIEGATMYLTHQPCLTCAKLIIQARIKRVVFAKPYYTAATATKILQSAGIKLVNIATISKLDSD